VTTIPMWRQGIRAFMPTPGLTSSPLRYGWYGYCRRGMCISGPIIPRPDYRHFQPLVG